MHRASARAGRRDTLLERMNANGPDQRQEPSQLELYLTVSGPWPRITLEAPEQIQGHAMFLIRAVQSTQKVRMRGCIRDTVTQGTHQIRIAMHAMTVEKYVAHTQRLALRAPRPGRHPLLPVAE